MEILTNHGFSLDYETNASQFHYLALDYSFGISYTEENFIPRRKNIII